MQHSETGIGKLAHFPVCQFRDGFGAGYNRRIDRKNTVNICKILVQVRPQRCCKYRAGYIRTATGKCSYLPLARVPEKTGKDNNIFHLAQFLQIAERLRQYLGIAILTGQ